MKKLTRTKAQLPEDEKVIGGDVSKKMLNDRKVTFKKLFKKVKR
jgi:hypothetical protein